MAKKAATTGGRFTVAHLNAALRRSMWLRLYDGDEALAARAWDQYHRQGLLRHPWAEAHLMNSNWLTGEMIEEVPEWQ